MIKLLIGNITTRIIGYLPDEVHDALDQKLSYTPKDVRHITSVKEGKWDGRFRLYKKSWQTFDTGLMSLATKIFDEHAVEYRKVDERKRPEITLPHLEFTPAEGYEKRDYQQFSIDRAYSRTRGILQMATASGKTMTVAELIGKIQTSPFMFYVLTKDLMNQAYDTLSSTLNEPIGRIGGGLWDIKKINVCTIQTAIRAINLGNKAFKISDYKFDEEDLWDKKDLEGEDKLINLKQLLHATKGLYFDECITGDSELTTEKGSVRIDDIKLKQCEYVLSYDGEKTVYKPILQWFQKGYKEVIELICKHGKIRCTKDHLIYTTRGWVEAGDVIVGEEILYNDQNILKEWKPILEIKRVGTEMVYDIEVQDTHCFFANGILVHNCHHASAKTCKDVINASPNAFWKYGGSATPYREDGAEIVLQSLFGRKIVEISASYLIDKGYLLEPYIFFEPVYHDCKLHSYQSIYSECVVKDEAFNLHVADTANFLIEHELSTLILVQQIAHGKFLQKHIPGSVLVTGDMPTKKREQAIQDLRDKKKLCMIATCLADEGLDIPTLDVALLPGGGSSATRVNQRIGRTLRRDRKAANPRDRAVVVYYRHYVKYLEQHALKAARIMKKEPRFNVVKSKGKDHILGEISEVFGLDYHPKTIFNL